MNEQIVKLKKLLIANKEKRVLVLGTYGNTFKNMYTKLNIGVWYEKILDDLFIEQYGYIDLRYIPEEEKNKIANSIKIEKGEPIFSHKILDSDIIIFIYIPLNILRILCYKENISYNKAKRLQDNMEENLKKVVCPVIKIELYKQSIALKKVGRNVYIYDDNNYDLTDKKNIFDYDDNYYFRFPYLKRVTNINELKRKHGFLLIINAKYLDEEDYIEIDKKYRNLFKQFNLTYIVTKNTKLCNLFHLRYTNIYFVNEDYFNDDELMEIYYEYILNNKKLNFSKKKLLLFDKINEYLKTKTTVKTSELREKFHMSERNIERYMNDYNKIYKNIGYDFIKNEWYVIK